MQITVYHAFLVVACSLQEHLQSNVLLFFILVLVFVATGLDFHHSCLKQLLCSCGVFLSYLLFVLVSSSLWLCFWIQQLVAH